MNRKSNAMLKLINDLVSLCKIYADFKIGNFYGISNCCWVKTTKILCIGI